VTASSVASVKVEFQQLEELAHALGVPLPATGSGAALFRLCVARARQLVPVIAVVDRIQLRARARALIDAETDNASALEALQRALGGQHGDATGEAERQPAPPNGC
jgi:hypothetical protein